ncbi:hypothetical protein DL93DRAFT_268245 [Clavulina sp. PMI_390]|nr:hypothetical protein DL93DRAFT_268245 [Clavulina sp. PMI_390]
MSRQLMAGWIGGAIWTNNAESPTQSFTAKWTVPPLPPADGQNLFLFISLEPITHTCLLQPVLQYGAYGPGGGNYWAVSNWWSYGWDYYYTTLIPVSPGRVLNGVIENTGQWFTGWNYQSYFTDIGDPMRVYGIPRLDYATETFRAQYFLTTNDFPPAWTTFSNINMKLIGGWPVGLMWSPVNTPQDGLYSVINIQGAQGAEVTVVY